MSNPIIKFEPIDRSICFQIGCERNASALMKNMQLESGRTDFGFDRHIIGAFGEFAVARYLGTNWEPVVGRTDTTRGDVGKVQVKSSRVRNSYLFVRKQDPGHFIYVRCFVLMTQVELMGWARGDDCKTDEFWKVPPECGLHHPCFVYPQDRLLPMDELKLECYT